MKVASLILGIVTLGFVACAPAHAADSVAAPVGQSDSSDIAFVDWARPRVVPLQDFPSNAATAERVGDIVGSARMVSFGEPAHGAHEPLAFRNRLFQFLVEHRGFTAIALESGFNEARLVNDYVLGGEGDPREIARAGLTWGFGGFAENVELLQWMRAYNADRVRGRQVRFYGIDLTGGDSAARFAKSSLALEDALSYLTRADARLAARAREAVAPFVDRFSLEKYRSLSADERRALQSAIEDVIALFSAARRRLIAASSESEYEWALRSIIVAKQLETLFRLSPANVSATGVVAEFQQAAAARDAAMADNALWSLQREGPSGRVLVFAHNAHIMNAPLRGGLWNVYAQPPSVMGQHLRTTLGKDLVIIGTSSSTNGPGLPAAPSEAASIDAALARLGLPHFILDLRAAPHTTIPWLQHLQSLRANFTTEMEVSLPDAFDALVYFDQLRAAGQN